MAIVTVTGGKGGTGKSFIATNLALALSEKNTVALADADVDCPNDNILFGIAKKELKAVSVFLPKVDPEKCDMCGICAETCRYGAIIMVSSGPNVIPTTCTGCKACQLACPQNAILSGQKAVGIVHENKVNNNLTLYTGELHPGEPNSSAIIKELKKVLEEDNSEFKIIDTAAGTHCDVVEALEGSDIAIVVTEPTPFGAHDAKLVMKVLTNLEIPYIVVLNRSGLGKIEIEHDFEIPYSKEVEKAYASGKPFLKEFPDHEISKSIKTIAESVKSLLE